MRTRDSAASNFCCRSAITEFRKSTCEQIQKLNPCTTLRVCVCVCVPLAPLQTISLIPRPSPLPPLDRKRIWQKLGAFSLSCSVSITHMALYTQTKLFLPQPSFCEGAEVTRQYLDHWPWHTACGPAPPPNNTPTSCVSHVTVHVRPVTSHVKLTCCS